MKKTKLIATVLLTLIFFSCSKNNNTVSTLQGVDDRSIDSFNITLQPIGDGSGGSFSEFGISATGYLSLFKKAAYEKVEAKANYLLIDLVYYTSSSNSLSSNGKIHFNNPTILNGGFGSAFNLGWVSYTDKPQFVGLLKSQRVDNASGGYLGLNEEEFDKLITPEGIHYVFTHSLKNGAEKKSDHTIDYFASKTERIAIFGMLDTQGRESIIKIKPEQSIYHLFAKVKRGYSN